MCAIYQGRKIRLKKIWVWIDNGPFGEYFSTDKEMPV